MKSEEQMQPYKLAWNWRSWLQNTVLTLSVVILFTSLIDLFVNRLLFRSGPEAFSHLDVLGASELAVVGRISLTLEQLILFVIIGFSAILLLQERRSLYRVLGVLLIPIVACSALLYASLSNQGAWDVSTVLVLATVMTVVGLASTRASKTGALPQRQRVSLYTFLTLLVLSFSFVLYYRAYLLFGAVGLASLPFGIESYQAGIYSVMATTLAVFAYALLAPSPGFTLNFRNLAKAAILPTLVVVPIAIGLFESYFMTQIFTMVVAMSTDIVLSHELLQAIVILWWFFLTGALLLILKGHYSANKQLMQEGVGLILIMSTTFLFNYPYYILLGIAGVLLVSYPFTKSNLASQTSQLIGRDTIEARSSQKSL